MHLRRLLLALVLLSWLGPTQARAQTITPTPTTPTTSFTKDDFTIRIQKNVKKKPTDKDSWVFIPDIEAKYFFNTARCECKTPIRVTVDLTTAGFGKRGLIGTDAAPPSQGTVQMLIGPSNCLDTDATVRSKAVCRNPMGENAGTSFSTLGLGTQQPAWSVEMTVNDLFVATGRSNTVGIPEPGRCSGDSTQFTQKIWLWLPTSSGNTPYLTGDAAPQLSLSIDGFAPPAPSGVILTPGNEALNVSWQRLMGIGDLNGYVVFCSRAGMPVFADTYYSGTQFHTPQTECNMGDLTTSGVGTDGRGDVGNGVPINAPPWIHNLSSAYACSPLLTSSTSRRIATLQNAIPYIVGVAAVDRAGNASLIENAYVQKPIFTRDFYTAYRDDGGAAEGGFCSFGRHGRATVWAMALVAGLALALRRRR
jgi:hypothetical protein